MTGAMDGPWQVIRWGSRWSIEDVLNPCDQQPRFDLEADAAAEVERRNAAHAARCRPRPRQGELFGGLGSCGA